MGPERTQRVSNFPQFIVPFTRLLIGSSMTICDWARSVSKWGWMTLRKDCHWQKCKILHTRLPRWLHLPSRCNRHTHSNGGSSRSSMSAPAGPVLPKMTKVCVSNCALGPECNVCTNIWLYIYTYISMYICVCVYACTLLVMAKYFENPWTKAKKLVIKYSLNT